MFNRGWLWVLFGGFIEALWPCLMNMSEGMDNLVYTVLGLVFSILATVALNMGLKRGTPVGGSYAVWVGIGVAGTAIADFTFFGESANILEVVCLMLIFGGVAGMNLESDRKKSSE